MLNLVNAGFGALIVVVAVSYAWGGRWEAIEPWFAVSGLIFFGGEAIVDFLKWRTWTYRRELERLERRHGGKS